MVEITLPSANCAFKIPSLHDELELDCRLYFPKRIPGNDDTVVSGFAIFAHPYAPLGGCYDDSTVQLAASALLKQGFVTCTFNFRGATNSLGSTSWTGKSELADYVSVYVFMFYLMNLAEAIDRKAETTNKPLLILGGYSYGSMIASHLPSLEIVKSICGAAQVGSCEHEVAARAQEMTVILQAYLDARAIHARHDSKVDDVENDSSNAVMVGGYDSKRLGGQLRQDSARKSIDHERVRHSIDRLKGKFSMNGRKPSDSQQGQENDLSHDDQIQFAVDPEIGYLLISPILQPVSGFTTIFSHLSFERKDNSINKKTQGSWETNICGNPTMAIYGDRDTFTSATKLRKWIQRLQSTAHSRFTSQEITGAGHFWQEAGARKQLFTTISLWSASLCSRISSTD